MLHPFRISRCRNRIDRGRWLGSRRVDATFLFLQARIGFRRRNVLLIPDDPAIARDGRNSLGSAVGRGERRLSGEQLGARNEAEALPKSGPPENRG